MTSRASQCMVVHSDSLLMSPRPHCHTSPLTCTYVPVPQGLAHSSNSGGMLRLSAAHSSSQSGGTLRHSAAHSSSHSGGTLAGSSSHSSAMGHKHSTHNLLSPITSHSGVRAILQHVPSGYGGGSTVPLLLQKSSSMPRLEPRWGVGAGGGLAPTQGGRHPPVSTGLQKVLYKSMSMSESRFRQSISKAHLMSSGGAEPMQQVRMCTQLL